MDLIPSDHILTTRLACNRNAFVDQGSLADIDSSLLFMELTEKSPTCNMLM